MPRTLSNALDTRFCLDALEMARACGTPVISNTDQRAQLTSTEWTDLLKREGVQMSMDGRGCPLDNVFV